MVVSAVKIVITLTFFILFFLSDFFFRESLLGRKTGHVQSVQVSFSYKCFISVTEENVEAVEIKSHVCITSRSLYSSSYPELQPTLDFGTPSLA